MAITITISTNRQIKTADGGSIGATAGMTVELVTPASATDAEIQREIRHHYETVTGAMTDQLRELAARRADTSPQPPNGTPQTPTPLPAGNGNGKPSGTAAPAPTKAPAAQAAPAAPASTAAKPKANGTPKATAAPATSRPTPPQPAAQRIALDAELARQFAPHDPEPEDDLDDEEEPLAGESVNAEDDGDDTPRTGRELLGWARSQPGDAKQELAAIGMHLRHPALILNWTPEQVAKAYAIYRRTSSD
jgi:hypothetical protein